MPIMSISMSPDLYDLLRAEVKRRLAAQSAKPIPPFDKHEVDHLLRQHGLKKANQILAANARNRKSEMRVQERMKRRGVVPNSQLICEALEAYYGERSATPEVLRQKIAALLTKYDERAASFDQTAAQLLALARRK